MLLSSKPPEEKRQAMTLESTRSAAASESGGSRRRWKREVVMVALVAEHGVQYLFAAVVLTGVLQISAGLLRLGKYIRIVPHPVMLGFVNGLAIVIFLAQLGQFGTPGEPGWLHGTFMEGSIVDVAWLEGLQLWVSAMGANDKVVSQTHTITAKVPLPQNPLAA